MEKKISLKEWLQKEKLGEFNSADIQVQLEAGWFDWFCKDKSLFPRLKRLIPKLKRVAKSSKIDQDKTYVFFKNNCPVNGSLYDDFRICDLETGDVIYIIIPKSGHNYCFGLSEVWGKENDFSHALAAGSWDDIRKFFGV